MQIAFRLTMIRLIFVLVYAADPTIAFANEHELPKRIVSVNLCADQMLMALAPRSKIVALGPYSRDPLLSFFSSRAETFPQVRARSETLLQLETDAIAVGPFDNAVMRQTIKRRNIEEIIVGRWTNIGEVLEGVASFADAIGEAAAGAELVEEISSSLKSLRGVVAQTPAPSFLMLHRRGYVGEGGLVSELLEMAGLVDAAKTQPSRFLSVEAVVALRPSMLVVSGRNLKSEDRGLELLEHPALAALYPAHRRLSTPDVLTVCGGPSTPTLIRHLREELIAWIGKK